MGSQRLRHDLVIKQQQQLTAFGWVFILAAELSNFDWLLTKLSNFLFIVTVICLSINSLLRSFSVITIFPIFWTHGPVDWWGLSHHLFLQGNSLVLFIGSGSSASWFYLYDYESRRNSCLWWFWWVTLIWEHPYVVFMSLVFLVWGLFWVWTAPCLSSGCAGPCPLNGGSGWYCSDHGLPWMLGGAFSLLCACHSPVEYRVSPQLL